MKKEISLVKDGECIPILVEDSAYDGVKKIAEKIVSDIKTVAQCTPSIYNNILEATQKKQNVDTVLFATIGKSKLLESVWDKTRISECINKREVFGIELIEAPWEGVGNALIIYGSDKRGTIYGMFELSRFIGISPLHYWGDVKPKMQQEIRLNKTIETISKEPSVKYRGFFINDEWPCFGNWTFEHFGGFTAEMYDKVFELLLRFKGNYLWPAMWTSSFCLDGPGLESARLADLYGVIIGNSHHEPCLRASEEWDICRGPETKYGNEWNFDTNEEGLLKYWEDGLIRGQEFESIITIGMRGERDSSMLGPDASLKKNIDLLKDIITKQKKLINKHVKRNMPQLLAIYKEVEEYFYGNETVEGLKKWDVLDDVTLMFCEDNFGNMRTLPSESMKDHKGGFGMYYHLDYHGDPISYEWVNSTPLSKIWEQMTMAYEYGIRDVWIVNVGDLKFQEFPLSYFLTLAYDFDRWGTTAINKTKEYTQHFLDEQFGKHIPKEIQQDMETVLTETIQINSIRKPEALNSKIYHPVHYQESNDMLNRANHILKLAATIKEKIPDECQDAYYSMIHYPALVSMNLLNMHLYAGKNEHYARQGKKIANEYAKKVTKCIENDRTLADEFGKKISGKWNGMQLAPHIGFTKWNEDNSRYPLRILVEPANHPRLVVSRADQEEIAIKDYFAPMVIEVKDFLSIQNDRVDLEIANDGTGILNYQVIMEPCEWLTYKKSSDQVESQEILQILCIRENLPKEQTMQIMKITDGDTEVEIHIHGKRIDDSHKKRGTYFENNKIIAMRANHYTRLTKAEKGKLILLNDYGRTGYGLKAFPVNKTFPAGEGPGAIFSYYLEQEADYITEVITAPSNPVEERKSMCYTLRFDDGEQKIIDSIPNDFIAGKPHNKPWTEGVLNQVRKSKSEIHLQAGYHEIEISMIDPGFVLEEIILYQKNHPPKESYLGPKESYRKE